VEPTSWTDERLDDAIARIEQRFEAIDRRFDRVDNRIDDGFNRVWTEFGTLRSELVTANRLVAQIGWTLAAVFLAQTIAAIVAVIALS
jgi:hypothetical protein